MHRIRIVTHIRVPRQFQVDLASVPLFPFQLHPIYTRHTETSLVSYVPEQLYMLVSKKKRTVVFSLLDRLLDVEFAFTDQLRIPRVVRPASNFEDSVARGTGRDDRGTERVLRQSFLEFDASGRDVGPLRRTRRHGRSGEDSSLVRHDGGLGRELLFASEAVLEDLEPELCVPFRLLPSALDRVGPLLVQAVRDRTVGVLLADANAVREVLCPQHDDDERPEEAFLRRRRRRGRDLDHDSASSKLLLSAGISAPCCCCCYARAN